MIEMYLLAGSMPCVSNGQACISSIFTRCLGLYWLISPCVAYPLNGTLWLLRILSFHHEEVLKDLNVTHVFHLMKYLSDARVRASSFGCGALCELGFSLVTQST